MVDPRVLCRSCMPCKAGQSHCCKNLGYVGGSTGYGGFGGTVVVGENSLLRLPSEIPLDFAAVLEPLAVVKHAINVSGITEWKDREVLVVGGGPIGFALLLVLKAVGANRVTVSEPAAMRRKQVAAFAQAVINPAEENVSQRIAELTEGGPGVEVVFDCAGVAAGLDSALEALRVHGLYVMVAVWETPVRCPRPLLMPFA